MRLINSPCTIAKSVNVADATPTTVCSFDLATLPTWGVNVPFRVIGELQGKITSGINLDSMGGAIAVRQFKNVSGVLSAISILVAMGLGGVVSGNFLPLLGDAGVATSAMTLDISGTVARLRATGIVATNMTFTGALWVMTGEF